MAHILTATAQRIVIKEDSGITSHCYSWDLARLRPDFNRLVDDYLNLLGETYQLVWVHGRGH